MIHFIAYIKNDSIILVLLFIIPTHPAEIFDILKKLKQKNSAGHDNVSTKLLKSLDASIGLPLSILANSSMQTGIVTKLQK